MYSKTLVPLSSSLTLSPTSPANCQTTRDRSFQQAHQLRLPDDVLGERVLEPRHNPGAHARRVDRDGRLTAAAGPRAPPPAQPAELPGQDGGAGRRGWRRRTADDRPSAAEARPADEPAVGVAEREHAADQPSGDSGPAAGCARRAGRAHVQPAAEAGHHARHSRDLLPADLGSC